MTALHVASIYENLALCDLLIQNGSDINAVDSKNWTALHHAVMLNCVSVVILLIRRGARLTLKDDEDKVCSWSLQDSSHF